MGIKQKAGKSADFGEQKRRGGIIKKASASNLKPRP